MGPVGEYQTRCARGAHAVRFLGLLRGGYVPLAPCFCPKLCLTLQKGLGQCTHVQIGIGVQ